MAKEPDFVSRQTYDARRFYLDLQPSNSHPLTVVCGGVERMNDGSPHTAKLCESLVRVLFQKIEQRIVSSEPGELPEALHTFEVIRQLMIDRFMEFPTIEEAAIAGGISPVYLSRLFKRFGGCGAYRFLLRLRMNYAAELLMDQGLKVVEVAERLQYADAFQFSRAFKRVYGIPPSKLSMRHRNR